jgi:hypothetical protein
MNEKEPEESDRGSALRRHGKLERPNAALAKLGAEKICPAEYMGPGARCTQERRGLAAYTQLARSSNPRWPHVVRRCNRRKTTNGSRSGASDGSGGRSIFMPSSRHRLKSRARRHKRAAFGRAGVDAPALRSVQAHDVRRSSARQKMCCLPTRMMAIVLDRAVPRGEVADPVVCPPRLGGQCKTPPRIHN